MLMAVGGLRVDEYSFYPAAGRGVAQNSGTKKPQPVWAEAFS
ncbi:hypothetical protein N008_10890 [Hymenobacter sp. APR13]|nr:hypothetical protein N008_10890 [Hymenobacter sp. APR13]